MAVGFAIAVGCTAGVLLLAHAVRAAWRATSPEAIDRLLAPALPPADPSEVRVVRATDEHIENILTADLFSGAIDRDRYRRALEILAAGESATAGRLAAQLPTERG